MKANTKETDPPTTGVTPPAFDSAALSPERVHAGLRVLQDLQSSLPFGPALSGPEQRTFRRIGPQTLRSIQNSLDAARQHGDSLPSGFDLQGFASDAALVNSVAECLAALEDMTARARGTLMVLGTRATQAASEVQGHIRVVANRVSRLQHTAGHLTMRVRAPKRKGKPSSVTPAPAAVASPAPSDEPSGAGPAE